MQTKPNLVQVEFFLPEGSSALKQTVRFFDWYNDLTLLALKIELLEAKKTYYLHCFESAKGYVRRRLYRFLCRRLDLQLATLAGRKIKLARKRLLEVSSVGGFAVEQNDRHFRPVRPYELPGVLEAVKDIRGVWLFVFGPNDLCADKNYAVASAM